MKQLFCASFLIVVLVSSPFVASAKTPDDPLLSEQWYLSQINAYEAWDITRGNSSTVVAVIDSGVDIDHPDLEDKIWRNSGEIAEDGIDNDDNGFVDDVSGWDFVGDDADPRPSAEHGISGTAFNHGTLVAGIIAATTDNHEGVAGINWRAKIMPVRILDGVGAGDTVTAALALDYAVAMGADVVNMSFTGYNAYDAVLEDAIRRAYEANVLIVAAVGNEDTNVNTDPIYPACFRDEDADWVLGVAASDENDNKADFSNYGSDCTDITAPGTGIIGAINDEPNDPTSLAYGGPYDGTSAAAPQVTGVVALIKGGYPDLTPEQLRIALQLSVDPMNVRGTPYQGQMGAGRVNVARALEIARELVIVAWGGESALF